MEKIGKDVKKREEREEMEERRRLEKKIKLREDRKRENSGGIGQKWRKSKRRM